MWGLKYFPKTLLERIACLHAALRECSSFVWIYGRRFLDSEIFIYRDRAENKKWAGQIKVFEFVDALTKFELRNLSLDTDHGIIFRNRYERN